MTGFVVDASVAVKWLVDEAYTAAAVRLLDGKRTLIAPELLFAEVSNALWALCRRGDLVPSDVVEGAAALRTAPVRVLWSMRDLSAAATRLAIDLDHPVYDCFYLALAMQEQFPVVTADVRFHDKVREHSYLAATIVHVASVSGDRS